MIVSFGDFCVFLKFFFFQILILDMVRAFCGVLLGASSTFSFKIFGVIFGERSEEDRKGKMEERGSCIKQGRPIPLCPCEL